MRGYMLCDLLQSVSHVRFFLEGAGEETHESREIYDAIQEWVKDKTSESMPEYEKLKERDRAKKPEVDGEMGYFICPSCESAIAYLDKKETHKFCLKCGQRIDWTEQEE